MYKVFLSSTGRDLKEYREAVYDAVHRMDGFHCVRMEDFGARPDAPLDYCRERVAACDVFVGITGLCYGSCPPREATSYTEHEYNAAAGKPRLMFVAPDDFPLPGNLVEPDKLRRRQQRFRKRIQAEQIVASFRSPEALAAGVVEALAKWWSARASTEGNGEQPAAGPGPLYGVPSPPPNFVPRPDELSALKALLLAGEGPIGVSGQGTAFSIQGMGGIGKSVLAAALARDEEVRSAFPDGILWLTVGREPMLPELQARVYTILTGQERAFRDEHDGRAQLGAVLARPCCLLVLDDVWEVAHGVAFDALGPKCRLLLTTRSTEVVRALCGHREHRVAQLPEDKALEVLARSAGLACNRLPPEARAIARECGYLPLALALAGAVTEGRADMWLLVLKTLQDADWEQIEAEFKDYPYPHVFAAIEASVVALGKDADRYLDLAVFREDVAIPEAALRALWQPVGLSDFMVRRLADRLVARNLAARDTYGRLSLHDLQGDFVRKRAFFDLADRHRRLLDGYRAQCSGEWWSGPDDDYFFQHLLWHLDKARERDQLRDLLFDIRWMCAKLAATSVTELAADYELIPGNRQASRLAAALRLSAHTLSVDSGQLASQLYGRLGREDGGNIARLLDRARRHAETPVLLPRWPMLVPKGTPPIRSPTGHTDRVTAVTLLSNEWRALSGGADGTLRLWDVANGAELRRFKDGTHPVDAVPVFAGGLRLSALESGVEPRRLGDQTRRINAVAVLADGSRALSGSDDGRLRLWDLENGAEPRCLGRHALRINAVAVLANEHSALSGSADSTLRLWDLRTGAELRRLEGHAGGVSAVAVLPDKCRAISGSYDSTLRLWDLKTGAELRRFVGHTGPVTVAALADGRRALSGSYDGTLRLWNLERAEELRRFEARGTSRAVAALADGRRALSSSDDTTLRLWDLEAGTLLAVFTGDAPFTCLALTSDGRSVVAGDAAGNVHLIDILLEPPSP